MTPTLHNAQTTNNSSECFRWPSKLPSRGAPWPKPCQPLSRKQNRYTLPNQLYVKQSLHNTCINPNLPILKINHRTNISDPPYLIYGRLQKMEHGHKMIYAGLPSFLGLGLEDGHVPTFWLLLLPPAPPPPPPKKKKRGSASAQVAHHRRRELQDVRPRGDLGLKMGSTVLKPRRSRYIPEGPFRLPIWN